MDGDPLNLHRETSGYHTAFLPFTVSPSSSSSSSSALFSCPSMNKKMIQFLRSSWNLNMIRTQIPEEKRCYQHMLNERFRRERQKQSYLALHALLPPGTKNVKNSIIQTASKLISELQWCREELKKRKSEFDANLEGGNNMEKTGGTKIQIKVPNPTSGVDSMLQVLKCLKNMGSKTTTVRADFSHHQLSTVLNIDTQMVAGDVEKAVYTTLHEVEKKLSSFPNPGRRR